MIGFDAAATLGAAFLRDTTSNVVLAGRTALITSYVAFAPAQAEALLDPHIAAGTALILADGDGCDAPGVEGFGRCLLQTVTRLLERGHSSVCVLNADGPTLPTRFLIEAARLLAQPGDRAVLGPTRDGGYYLLGLKRPHAAVFADIAWSTDTVAATTRARADAIGLELAMLPDWFDVDDGSSLEELVSSLDRRADGGFEAPATRAALERLGIVAGPPRQV